MNATSRRRPALESTHTPERLPLRRAFQGLLAILVLTPVFGCATKGDIRNLQTEIRELTSRQQALLQELRQAQREQDESISQVSDDIRDFRAETSRRVASIEDQLLTVQELAGLSQQQVASLRDQLERDRTQRSFGPPSTFGGPPGGGGDQAQEVYNAALTQYQRGTLSAARMGFRTIIEQYGGHQLAPEARYYLAEILAREGSLEEAIAAFEDIREFHPTADRVPDALYRAGLLYLELGDDDAAEEHFERVVNTWPDSVAADLARDALRNQQ